MTELEIVLIATTLSAVIGPIVVTRYRYYLENKKKKKNPVGKSLKHTVLVDEQIMDLRTELDACRVWISQFHNGGNFYPTGTSIQKFSIFYEQIKPGAASVKHTFQNIPVSLFAKPTNHIYQEGELLIPNYKQHEDFGLKEIAESTNARSSYIFALNSIDGEFLGTMGVEYCSRARKLTDEQLNECRTTAITVGTLLSTYLYGTDKPKK
jgi:hypothetical protein